MKTWLIAASIILFFVTSGFSEEIILAKKKTASCNASTNEVGTRTASTDHYGTMSGTQMLCVPYTADCSGTLGYAYSYHYGTASDQKGKICVYSEGDSDEDADASDSLLGCSGEFSCSTCADQTWYQSATKVDGSVAVTNGTTYWLCLLGDAWGYYGYHNLSKSWSYKDGGLTYASPSSTLDISWTSVTGYREMIIYVEIE